MYKINLLSNSLQLFKKKKKTSKEHRFKYKKTNNTNYIKKRLKC